MQPRLHLRCVYAVIAAALTTCLHPHTLEAAYVTGVTAITTMGSGFGTDLQNTVNGAGLSSRSLTAPHAGTTPNNSWVSTAGVLTGSITFDLHASLVITGFSFWNQNGGGPLPGTGVRNVAITYSTDGVTFSPLPNAPTQFNQVSAAANVPPQIFTFPSVLARHIRFQILSNYGDPDETGFAEVAFNGAPNQPPIINAPATITTAEDTAFNFKVTTADPDGDPDEPPPPVFGTPAKGTIIATRTDSTYIPNPNANGGDSFTITATDVYGGVTTRTVNVTVTPVNDAPLFLSAPETLATDEDTTVNFSVSATDVDGDPVTLNVAGATKGAITGEAGNYRYTPNSNLNGADSFTITADDGNGGVTIRTVSLTITPVNDAPRFTFIPSSLRTSEDAEVHFTVTTSDVENDLVTVAFSGSSKGAVSGDGPGYTYTPNPGVAGNDSVAVTATDSQGGVTIQGVNVRIIGAPTIAGRYALILADETGVHASLGLILSRRGFISGFLRSENGGTERFYRTVQLAPGERSFFRSASGRCGGAQRRARTSAVRHRRVCPKARKRIWAIHQKRPDGFGAGG